MFSIVSKTNCHINLNPTWCGLFLQYLVWGGPLWPPLSNLGNFWPFFEKMGIIQKQLYFNPFLHKNHPWHNFLVQNFSNPQKRQRKNAVRGPNFGLENFGPKIRCKKVFYIKFDWNQFVFEEKRSFLENGQKLWKILYWGAILAPPHILPISFHNRAIPVNRYFFYSRFCS